MGGCNKPHSEDKVETEITFSGEEIIEESIPTWISL